MSSLRCSSRSVRWYAASTLSLHEIDAGACDVVSTAEAQRIKDLEREVRELRKASKFLKLASAFFAQAELYRRIKS